MSRKVAVLGAAIGVLLLASLVLIWRVTAPAGEAPAAFAGPQAGPARPVPGSAAAAPVPASPGGTPSAPPPGAVAPPTIPLETVPAPVPTPPPAWLEGSTATLGQAMDPTPLGSLKPFVASGIGALQRRVAECAHEAPAGAPVGTGRRRTTLTLHIESLDNYLRIVDATPGDLESSTDWRVQCAQRKLREQLIPAPSKKGQFFEVPFVLNL
ncbi:MAG: hypothetical protein HZB56_01665 [Deltaproteobacteria bacterium]|nr:hypothetical protein [Deltaproteobacteria bacterium]